MRRFISLLPPGVKQALLLLAVVYGVALILKPLNVNLWNILGLSVPDFWKGRVWQCVTYMFLPGGFLDFLLNGLFFIMLSPRLEQAWSRGELWSYCLIGAVGGGLGPACLLPGHPVFLVGLSPVIIALLVGWLKLFGSEEASFMGLWQMTVRNMILLVLGVSLVISIVQCGLDLASLVPSISAGLFAWLYLVIRWRRNAAVSARAAAQERVRHLEL